MGNKLCEQETNLNSDGCSGEAARWVVATFAGRLIDIADSHKRLASAPRAKAQATWPQQAAQPAPPPLRKHTENQENDGVLC